MSKYKQYGKWFVMTAGASGLVLLVILTVMGLPLWLAFILAFFGAVPAAMALGVAGLFVWLEVDPSLRALERGEQEEQARLGQQFLDRSKRGRPRRGQ